MISVTIVNRLPVVSVMALSVCVSVMSAMSVTAMSACGVCDACDSDVCL